MQNEGLNQVFTTKNVLKYNIYHFQGDLQGSSPLQWVYSIPAFCRGQVKRRAPAVQTLGRKQDIHTLLINTI